MDGAEGLFSTFEAAGIRACFANPGTTELPMVRALDAAPGIRPVLGLFEGVCTGAADGYGRMTGTPAVTMLHLGPGLANGLANLHNARRAGTPVVNVVGDQPTWHLACDAPLTSDIVSLASPMSGWVRTAASARLLARDGAAAVAAALERQVATLIVPADCQWEEGAPVDPAPAPSPRLVPEDAVEEAAKALAGEVPVLLLGGPLSEPVLSAAERIASATGCRVIAETFPPRVERGPRLPAPQRLPYIPEMAMDTLDGVTAIILAGAREPVSFFGYPGLPSSLVPEGAAVVPLAAAPQDRFEDVAEALERLADRVGAGDGPSTPSPPRPDVPSGELTPESMGAVLAAVQPEGAIVVDESTSSGTTYYACAAGAPRHTFLSHVGGAIGQGLPIAVGAAVACPDRPVLAVQSDGAGMYTVQSLWTMAREGVNVTAVICSNRSYRILQMELGRSKDEPGPAARNLLEIGAPDLAWPALAEAMGVPGRRAETADELADALLWGLGETGPSLIEAILPSSA